MSTLPAAPAPPTPLADRAAGRADDANAHVYLLLTLGIQAVLAVGLLVYLLRRDWENAALTGGVILLTLAPAFVWRRWRVYVPPEFQLTSAAFCFLSLFLGSATDLYYRFWWWDALLHTTSGFLLGTLGFLAVFLLNRTDRLPREVRPEFVCIFAFAFGVTLGVLWEILEYGLDLMWPYLDMQTRESGVRDTMHDLIVDTLGALIVSAMGWAYYRTGRYSFIADGVRSFVGRNPRLFGRPAAARKLADWLSPAGAGAEPIRAEPPPDPR